MTVTVNLLLKQILTLLWFWTITVTVTEWLSVYFNAHLHTQFSHGWHIWKHGNLNKNKKHWFDGLFSKTTWVSQYQKGKSTLDFNEARDDGSLGWLWHQPDHMQTMCILLWIDNHAGTSLLDIYMPDTLPDAQKTMSKHWRLYYKIWTLKKYYLHQINNQITCFLSIKIFKKQETRRSSSANTQPVAQTSTPVA